MQHYLPHVHIPMAWHTAVLQSAGCTRLLPLHAPCFARASTEQAANLVSALRTLTPIATHWAMQSVLCIRPPPRKVCCAWNENVFVLAPLSCEDAATKMQPRTAVQQTLLYNGRCCCYCVPSTFVAAQGASIKRTTGVQHVGVDAGLHLRRQKVPVKLSSNLLAAC